MCQESLEWIHFTLMWAIKKSLEWFGSQRAPNKIRWIHWTPPYPRAAQDISRFFRIWGGSPGGQMNPLHLEEQLLHLPLEAMGGLAREIKGIILTYTIIILTISKDIYIYIHNMGKSIWINDNSDWDYSSHYLCSPVEGEVCPIGKFKQCLGESFWELDSSWIISNSPPAMPRASWSTQHAVGLFWFGVLQGKDWIFQRDRIGFPVDNSNSQSNEWQDYGWSTAMMIRVKWLAFSTQLCVWQTAQLMIVQISQLRTYHGDFPKTTLLSK